MAGTDDDVEPGAPATRAGAVRDWLDDLLERFPALGRLQAQLTGKRVPFQVGLAPAECGVACLTMVLGYHRKWVDVEEVRARLDARQGTDAQHVIAVARQFGLVGRAVSVASDEFRYLDPGSILYWNFNHFVVFERERRGGITILDPLAGRREIPSDEVRKHFTGIALTFEPGADFQHGGRRRSHFRRFLVDVLKDFSLAGRILFTSLVVQVLSLSLPFFTGMAVESVIPRSDRQLLLILCLSLAGVVGAFLLATLVRAHLIVFWQARLDARLNTSLMSHLLSLPYDFFQSRSRAEIAYRLESANALREGLTGAVVSAVLDGVMVLLYAGLVFWMNLRLGGVVTLLALLQVLTFALYWRREQVAAAEVVITTARSHTVASDLVDAIETVKAQSLERRASQYWVRAFVDSENAQIKRNQLNAWAEGLSATIRVGSPLVVLALGTQLVIDGRMGLGTMLALNFLAIGLFLPLGQLVQTALRLNALQSHAERLEDVFRAKAEHLGRPTASGRVSGAVELSRVHFRYGEMSPFGISDVSLRCEAGSVVALVGKSGSGKSTLAKLICGLYQPVSGQILYDGHQAEEWGLENLRRQVGYVPQTPRFFGTQSIRLNIAGLDSTVPLERIEAAARAAAIEAEIRALPLGYDSYLLNDGDAFSGGQKQRIALARALLVEPRILVLDEATSALDTLTEQEVYRTLSGLSCTRLIIAHRLSTIANADHIVVLDQGSVVDQGRHAELLGRCALYRALVQGQGEAP